MTKVSRRAFGAGVLTAALAGKAALAQETPKRGGTLVATWGGGEPQACYVPAGGGPSPTFSSSKLLERLASRRMDGEFQGELAEAWKPAADFKSYTIKIRKGVKFHDGKDMTADDVVYSIDEIWKKYAAAASLTDFAGVAAPDADTVVVRFSKPVPEFFFSSLLCGNANYIVPKHVYAGSDPVKNPANDAPIGTGPWKFKQWVRGSHFEYARNDAYWRQDAALPRPADHPLRARPGRPRRRHRGGRHPYRRAQSRGATRHQAADRDGQVRRHLQGL